MPTLTNAAVRLNDCKLSKAALHLMFETRYSFQRLDTVLSKWAPTHLAIPMVMRLKVRCLRTKNLGQYLIC